MRTPDPPAEPRFYMTCERRAQIEDIIQEDGVPTMQNAVTYYSDSSGLREFDSYGTPYVIDSGGYSAMDRYGGEFPWAVAEYDDWLKDAYDRHEFDWAAAMDLACEPAFDDVLTVDQRQRQTIANTIELADCNPSYPVLPVLQGRSIDQWVDCYDRLVDHGIDCSYVGVGTLCRQSSSSEIAAIERGIRARTAVEAMHGFGVKIASFNHGAYFESADSQAWSWPTKFGSKYNLEYVDRQPRMVTSKYEDSETAHRESFRAYNERATHLQQVAKPAVRHEHTTMDEW